MKKINSKINNIIFAYKDHKDEKILLKQVKSIIRKEINPSKKIFIKSLGFLIDEYIFIKKDAIPGKMAKWIYKEYFG